MAQQTRFNKARILLLGDADVGKTALAVRFITKRFIGEYDHNKEVLYTHRWIASRDDITIEILDSSNSLSDDVQHLESNIKWADGFLLIYSITDANSFNKMQEYLTLITQYRIHDDVIPIVLVANKTDCPPTARQVTYEEGQSLSMKFSRPIPFYELSVRDSPDGVVQVMEDILSRVKREFVKLKAGLGQRSTFTNVKRVLREKIYHRSRSDSLVPH